MASTLTEAREATKARLLTAAGELFAEKGFHGTKVRDIATRARVNLAAGNYHYGSKKELYLEVVRERFARISQQIEEMGAAVKPSDLARLPRRELIRLLRVRIEVMLEMLIGSAGDVHSRLMMREMVDPSEALPTIVREMILPLVVETRQVIAHLRPELNKRQVERVSLSIAGQIHFYRFMLPALLLLLGRKSYSRGFAHEVVDHVLDFSLGGMDHLVGRKRRAEA